MDEVMEGRSLELNESETEVLATLQRDCKGILGVLTISFMQIKAQREFQKV